MGLFYNRLSEKFSDGLLGYMWVQASYLLRQLLSFQNLTFKFCLKNKRKIFLAP